MAVFTLTIVRGREPLNDIQNIIERLEQQRAAIDNALAALREVSGTEPKKRRGRPPGSGKRKRERGT